MASFVSHVTGYDPVTRFRDFETISAPGTAFLGATPSRDSSGCEDGDLAKPLCLLAKTHKARCRWATGLVWARDESRGLVEWRCVAGLATEVENGVC